MAATFILPLFVGVALALPPSSDSLSSTPELSSSAHVVDNDASRLARAGKKKMKKRSKKKKKAKAKARSKRKPKKKGPVEIPIDIGIGPIALVPSTPLLLEDQPVHAGMMISLGAVIDKATIAANRDKIPKQYRQLAKRVSEVQVRPWWLAVVPKVLIISPGFINTGMYGAIWRPYSLGLAPEVGPVKLSFDAAIDLAYIFMHSNTPGEEFTNFLRPGLNLQASARLPLSKWFLISGGWSSSFFPPQKLGGWPWEMFPLERSVWHFGGPFFKLHVRVPYEVNL